MQFDMSAVTGSFDFLMKGLQYSLQLTLFATAIGIFFGTLLAMARLSSIKPLNLAASTYVNLFRSVPLLLVIFWFYILVPLVMGIDVGAEKSAYITFAIFEAAYFCEIIRAGIQSIPRGQMFAGQAMGFTYGQNMRYVILPQAFRGSVAPLGNTLIALLKNSTVAAAASANAARRVCPGVPSAPKRIRCCAPRTRLAPTSAI